jgi:hypothetical protein
VQIFSRTSRVTNSFHAHPPGKVVSKHSAISDQWGRIRSSKPCWISDEFKFHMVMSTQIHISRLHVTAAHQHCVFEGTWIYSVTDLSISLLDSLASLKDVTIGCNNGWILFCFGRRRKTEMCPEIKEKLLKNYKWRIVYCRRSQPFWFTDRLNSTGFPKGYSPNYLTWYGTYNSLQIYSTSKHVYLQYVYVISK